MFRRLTDLERRWRAHYNVAPVDDETWRRARIYNAWFDHAILRTFWTNQAEIAPGVWRSNHPTKARLARMKARGLRTVISLRGGADEAHNATERIWCAELGLTLRFVGMSDKALPQRETLLTLIETFREAEAPLLIHCKAGADRAGLASAIYLLSMTDTPWPRRGRCCRGGSCTCGGRRRGCWARARRLCGASGHALRDWVATVYDPA
jgi:protein tyrosine phosphatase (PTP) superfamily phosphohydrolase (DUF442 family)